MVDAKLMTKCGDVAGKAGRRIASYARARWSDVDADDAARAEATRLMCGRETFST